MLAFTSAPSRSGRCGSNTLRAIGLESEKAKQDQVVVREDFWTSTSNKQLNFVQHIYLAVRNFGAYFM